MASLKLVEDLKWASPLEIKKSLESAFTESFGTKEDYNKANAAASKASKGGKAKANNNGDKKADKSANENAQASSSNAAAPPVSNMFEEGFLAALHPVGGNPQIHEYLKQEHLKATGGLVHTRFPPEPNGESLI